MTSFALLPDDTLYLIFHDAAQDELFTFPLVISQVCGAWRRGALAMPTLWTSIRFVFRMPRDEPFALQYHWIKRSGSVLPLDILIQDRMPTLPHEEHLTQQQSNLVWEIITPLSHRWRSLSAQSVTVGVASLLVADVSMLATPQLTKLEVSHREAAPYAYTNEYQPPSWGPSNLQGCRINWLSITDASISHSFLHQCSDLVHLQLSRMALDWRFEIAAAQLIGILRQNHSLRHVALLSSRALMAFTEAPVVFHDDTSGLWHGSLEILDIPDYRLMGALLRRVSLPNLKSFGEARFYPEYLPSMTPNWGVDHPCPNLVNLHISVGNFWDDIQTAAPYMMVLSRALASLSRLESLTLSGLHLNDELAIHQLGNRCPALNNLTLKYCTGVSEVVLRDILKDRHDNGLDPLSRLVVMWCQWATHGHGVNRPAAIPDPRILIIPSGTRRTTSAGYD